MMNRNRIPVTLFVIAFSAAAQTTVKHIQTPNAGIASAVWAGDTLYVRGQTAMPVMNAAHGQFFGTKDQPNKPARSTVQVAALAASGALVEIE
jgi:enamine deaminase RidA (YjgF/YER057c/UK114 family)